MVVAVFADVEGTGLDVGEGEGVDLEAEFGGEVQEAGVARMGFGGD